ncbi:MAG: 50S ribosomal protein L25 [Calditrichaeota bacterium]|nr:MAG: 50S ribosomal protein L25 [Calditrichota bacterium]
MSETIISAQKREQVGTGVARALRRQGRIPGVLYGADSEALPVSFDKLELGRLLRSDFSLITVEVDGEKEQAVLKEVQNHPVRGDVLHVDMMRVASGHEIKVTVPINYTGESSGVKLGGLMSIMRNELTIQVLPKDMPEAIEVDVTNLGIGDVVRVKDLQLENVTVLEEPEVMLCQVTVTRKAAEALTSEGAEEAEESGTEEAE